MDGDLSKRLLIVDEKLSLDIKANLLFNHQVENWQLAKNGYSSLKSVKIKIFEFDDFTIEAHYNPGRIISSSAKVDDKSIKERPCFLCVNNLPSDQKAVSIDDDYILLVNPYPIFDKHFTIPTLRHIPQTIYSNFKRMLIISEMLGKTFSVFYNGPKCGASAPDHLHFQAGNFGFMKIDTEFYSILNKYGEIINDANDVTTTAVTNHLRNFISIESNETEQLVNEFIRVYKVLSENSNEEPLLNIICTYNEFWKVIIFPRTIHRPTYFYEEGEKKILISPAAVDLGGVLIFPREEDFNKINEDLVIDIFSQVTTDNETMNFYVKKLKY
ncbi:MAG: DUF4922 domain-containing protein [Melioribacteraceae bacterium]|nr:DUF4922 domain-containing protein [Melioribacteraceae bacterium]